MNPISAIDNLVIFDGHCNLCNRTVDFLVRKDKRRKFYFTSIQSNRGKELVAHFDKSLLGENKSVLFIQGGNIYRNSTAILRIIRLLPVPYRWLYVFILLPGFIRNGIYSFIAKNRYAWFGSTDNCRIPSHEDADRFI